MAAGAVRRQRGGAARRLVSAARYHAERHREGIPVARDLHLSARAFATIDRRHDRLVCAARAEVESDERVQLPLARGWRDTGARDRVLAGDRGRRARCRARLRSGGAGTVQSGFRQRVVLRQRGRSLRGRDVQVACLHRIVGSHRPRALRRHRRESASIPIRRAGQLTRVDRRAAREQRAAHRVGNVGCDTQQTRPRAQRAVARVERGARLAAAVGPAMVAAHAAGAGLRERRARVRRPVRRIDRGREADQRVVRRCVGGVRGSACVGWRVCCDRRVEGAVSQFDG